jgi:hypothetical protein
MFLSTVGELLMFLWARKKFWMMPLVLLMVLIGALQIVSHGSAFAPFIYALF